jgi:MFS family permease
VAFVGLACSGTYAQFMGCMAVAGAAAGGYWLWLVHGYRDFFFLFFSLLLFVGWAGRLTRGWVLAAPTTVAFSVVSQWFDARKGIATGCVTLGAPLGGIFFSLVLQTLFGRYPWRTAALVLVGIMAGLLVVGNLLVETNVLLPPAERQTASEDDPSERPAEATISNMLRSPKFWLVSYALFGKPRRSTRPAVS